MNHTLHSRLAWAFCPAMIILHVAVSPARGQVLINNGGFEVGFASWTRADQLGSLGTFALQTGTTSPVNGTTVPAPPGGTRAAMTDAAGPGSHVMYQDFVVPTAPILSAQLRFDVFVGNRASAFFIPSPASLDFSTPALNQQARVDILNGGTDPFSVSALDVLTTAFQTTTTDPLVSGYNTVTVNLTSLFTANAGNTLRLRFAEVDNVFSFQLGVDNVSLTATPVPEPSSLILCACGGVAGLRWMRRRNRDR
jgi:hypothetical protein